MDLHSQRIRTIQSRNVKRTGLSRGGSSLTHAVLAAELRLAYTGCNSPTETSRLRTRCMQGANKSQVQQFENMHSQMSDSRVRRPAHAVRPDRCFSTLQTHANDVMNGKRLGEVSVCEQSSTRQPDESRNATHKSVTWGVSVDKRSTAGYPEHTDDTKWPPINA
jgi:hypothetical protein